MIYFLILKFIGANVYRVFIEYCVFFDYIKIFRTLAFLCFPSMSVCVHNGSSNTSTAGELLFQYKAISISGSFQKQT